MVATPRRCKPGTFCLVALLASDCCRSCLCSLWRCVHWCGDHLADVGGQSQADGYRLARRCGQHDGHGHHHAGTPVELSECLQPGPDTASDSTNFRFWPSQARQLSELLARNRFVRTCSLSDCSRAMKMAEEAPASGQELPGRATALSRPVWSRKPAPVSVPSWQFGSLHS